MTQKSQQNEISLHRVMQTKIFYIRYFFNYLLDFLKDNSLTDWTSGFILRLSYSVELLLDGIIYYCILYFHFVPSFLKVFRYLSCDNRKVLCQKGKMKLI